MKLEQLRIVAKSYVLYLGKTGGGKVFFGIDPYYMEEDKAIEHIKKYFGMEDEK